MVNAPSQPSTPQEVLSMSNKTQITVQWSPIVVQLAELPAGQITYYKLFMDDGLFGEFD
jgi:hypothetical protein